MRISNGCAIAISTIGLFTLCEYIFGWNFGIDELLVRDLVTNIASDSGQMGTNTAVNFSLLGISLWLVNEAQSPPKQPQQVKLTWIAISQTLALVAGFIALQAVVGSAYNVRVFYQLSIFTTAMAFQTAVVFMILCGGILALNSVGIASQDENRGWMRAYLF
jgi:signal transduction histidine kinase